MTFEKVLITLLNLPYFVARAMFPITDDEYISYEDLLVEEAISEAAVPERVRIEKREKKSRKRKRKRKRKEKGERERKKRGDDGYPHLFYLKSQI